MFGAVLHLTHRDFSTRFGILKKRFSDHSPDELELLLSALESSLGLEQSSYGYSDHDQIDGEWKIPKNIEIREAKLQAWEFLFSRIEKETRIGPYVPVLTRNLNAVVRWGVATQIFGSLKSLVPQLSSHQKSEVRQALRRISSDLPVDSIEKTPYVKSYVELRQLLEPTHFSDRLFDLVGTWTPVDASRDPENIESSIKALDENLATEGLKNLQMLLNELDWLDTGEAVRASQFMFSVGTLDESRVMLQPMIERVRSGTSRVLLSSYLTGVGSVIDAGTYNSILRDLRSDPVLHLIVFDNVSRVGLTDETVEWVIEDIESGLLGTDDLMALQYGQPISELSHAHSLRLIELIASFNSTNASVTALNLLMNKFNMFSTKSSEIEQLLLGILAALSSKPIAGMDEHTWELASLRAVEEGHSRRVAEMSLDLMNLEDRGYFGQSAWKVLKKAIQTDSSEVWFALSTWLDNADDLEEYRFALGAQEPKLIEDFDIADVIEWVGDSTDRADRVARMASAHEAPLNDLARWLLISFGPHGTVADGLTSRAHSTPGAMWGPISNFAKTQMNFADQWSNDADNNVAEWGRDRKAEFERSYAADLAREEHRDLRNS